MTGISSRFLSSLWTEKGPHADPQLREGERVGLARGTTKRPGRQGGGHSSLCHCCRGHWTVAVLTHLCNKPVSIISLTQAQRAPLAFSASNLSAMVPCDPRLLL